MSYGREVAKRVVVAAVVALLVVAGAAVIPALSGPTGRTVSDGPDHPEYASDDLDPERLESTGQPSPDTEDVGTVVFDTSHSNRFNQEDVSSLTTAITQSGGEVKFTGFSSNLNSSLEDADVFVVIDPASRYGDDDLEVIREFVDNGGRLVLVSEPNRKALQAQGFGVALVTRRSRITELASEFGFSFGTEYIYDMENNDGNFKNPVASATEKHADSPLLEDVEQTTMYTATSVRVDRGKVLLRTADTAQRGEGGTERGFPVAAVNRQGNVLAVGDKTFLSDRYDSVADNDVFIARMVEFMAGADHDPRVSDVEGADGELSDAQSGDGEPAASDDRNSGTNDAGDSDATDLGASIREARANVHPVSVGR